MTLLTIFATFLFLGCSCDAAQKIVPLDERFVKALHFVEASSKMNPPDGDSGKAIGPFQIWRAYWQDAVEYDPSIGGVYDNCRDYNYAKKVVTAYMNRYAKSAILSNDFETLARLHNGGPSWKKRPIAVVSTGKYWTRVSAYLTRR